jgi:hypothetical protein
VTAAHWRLLFWIFAFFGSFGAGAGLWGWMGFLFAWVCLGVGYNLRRDQIEVDQIHDENA